MFVPVVGYNCKYWIDEHLTVLNCQGKRLKPVKNAPVIQYKLHKDGQINTVFAEVEYKKAVKAWILQDYQEKETKEKC